MKGLKQVLESIGELNEEAMEQTRHRVDHLIKPQGSLGKLENLAIQLSGITGKPFPKVDNKAVIVMAADHGVCEEGVAAAPQIVTKMMAINIANGVSGVGVLASHAGAEVIVVDIGIGAEIKSERIMDKKIRLGTANMTKGPAMTRDEAIQSLEVGIEIATQEIKRGKNIIAIGEMGIGNTTPTTAILSILGGYNPEEITGIGANLPEAKLENKINVIKEAIKVNQPDPKDGIDILAKVGGLEIGGMAGVILACAANRIPVVIDGYIAMGAALIAYAIEPRTRAYMIPSHSSQEKGASHAAKLLQFQPMLDMNMRLGEGSGAVLALHIIEAATCMNEKMITFEQASIGIV